MISKIMAVAAVLSSVVGAGTARDHTVVASRVYAAPQRLIAIDGARRLNLYCSGSGKPTVMLEAGAGNGMVTWRHVQGAIGKFTRVCAYDRAGLGFSDAAARASDDASAVDDLHRLLSVADISRPIVIVGHSLGGELALLFAATHPNEVAGAVLVDPSFPDMLRVLQAALPSANRTALSDGFRKRLDANRSCLILAQKGMLTHPVTDAAKKCVDTSDGPDKLDRTLQTTVGRQLALPRVRQAMVSETQSFLPNGNRRSVNSEQFDHVNLSFGDKPLIVLTRGNLEGAPGVPATSIAAMEAAWKAAHDGVARLSSRGISRIVPHTGHYIQVDQPGAVIDAVERVVTEVRRGEP